MRTGPETGPRGLTRCRGGFSLLELLSVIWVLSLLLFLGITTLVGAMKIEQTITAAANRQMQRTMLADQFRSDVATAVATPDQLDRFQASRDCLILRLADGNTVIYRFEASRLERAEVVQDGVTALWVSQGPALGSVEFVSTGESGQRLLTLRYRELASAGTRDRTGEISAALTGDAR
jgi:type II secretory pathway pseudopilin PulG